jgi:selenocysteine-specific elongation factor
MYVIGTAGHVDHGKSTLVKALTGIDPDRLAEERRREMTIDLGFAWLTLPSGRTVSLVDVPGHERFIKNMLAGVGGIDAALLVIAADEAVMPQTAEHLAILDLLGIEHGLVVLSKVDLVDDDWLLLVREEVRERLAGTSLAAAELVAASARTGQGLDELRAALDRTLDRTPSRAAAHGAPRLPIDRAFTIGGFGTVVTGTLTDGPLAVGEEVEILPRGLRARVRGLQTHKERQERALPGTRVAVNLAGVSHHEIARGDVLARPGTLRPTTMLDVQVRLVADAPRPLRQNAPLELFVGAAVVPCHATLLDRDEVLPGEHGWLQLRLDTPVAVARGDRYILRQPSPGCTIGGGRVLDAHPPRHRRFRADVTAALAALARGAPADLLRRPLADGLPHPWPEVVRAAGLSDDLAREALAELADGGEVVVMAGETGRHRDMEAGGGREDASFLHRFAASPLQPITLSTCYLVTASGWAALREKLIAALRGYHRRYPLRMGMPREELRSRLKLTGAALDAVLATAAAEGIAAATDGGARLPEHRPLPPPEQLQAAQRLLDAMAAAPYAPPAPDLDPELVGWLVEQGKIVRVAPDVAFLPPVYDELVAWVRAAIEAAGSVTVAQLRDRFGTSRKYALALLEHLDERRITRRQGEGRVLY